MLLFVGGESDRRFATFGWHQPQFREIRRLGPEWRAAHDQVFSVGRPLRPTEVLQITLQ